MTTKAKIPSSNNPSSGNEESTLMDADFKILAEDAPVMLWLTNSEGKVVFSNSRWRKFVGGNSKEALSNDAWIKALHPDNVQYCLDVFNTAFKTHQAFVMEYRLRRSDGEYRHILDTGEPYLNKEGNFSVFFFNDTATTERKNHENQLRISQLELKLHNEKMQLINELNSYLQVCSSLQETYPIIEHFSRKIFAGFSGVLYLFDESRTMVEAVARWGNSKILSLESISQDDCWGLRQGKPHIVESPKDAIVCPHIHGEPECGYVCAPIVAQGEMIGVLTITLELDAEDADDDSTEAGSLTSLEARTRLIAMAADNLAMALVSLKLREALRSRSVRDPLTKLFNRRYLEETLLRELSNCKRGNGELSVIMIDVDHFKTFNDTQGHDAGDFVLTELAMLMNTKLRKGDISCRYGGEEFVVVLPGASKEITMQRAEQLRVTFESHKFMHQARELKSVTASFGVATSPMNGVTVEAILKAADEAMYQAKEGGRNRVVAA